jgi:hypothetical protein
MDQKIIEVTPSIETVIGCSRHELIGDTPEKLSVYPLRRRRLPKTINEKGYGGSRKKLQPPRKRAERLFRSVDTIYLSTFQFFLFTCSQVFIQ